MLTILLSATYQVILPLYSSEQAVLNLASLVIGVATLFTHATISIGVLRGMKDTRSAAIAASITNWLSAM